MISVIIPAYNNETFLAETLRSLQAQTLSSWEAIVVDDGSDDGTHALAQTFAAEDSRITAYTQANSGASAARNFGLTRSNPTFPFVHFLDSDDVIEPDALQNLVTLLESHPDAAGSCGGYRDIDEDGNFLPFALPYESFAKRRSVVGSRLEWVASGAPVTFEQITFHDYLATGATLLRRCAIEKAGCWDESYSYAEDWDLWWRILLIAGNLIATEQFVMRYRQHPRNSSKNRNIARNDIRRFRRTRMTYPGLTAEERRVARLSYFYACLVRMQYAGSYLGRGRVLPALTEVARTVTGLARFCRDVSPLCPRKEALA
jgi:glycosyltransferase involved in cell wall biosynthesis